MAELPLDQGISRLKSNEDRFDTFVNGSPTTSYQTSGSVAVPSIRKFLADKGAEIDNAGDGLLAQTQAQATAAAGSATAAAGSATAAAGSAAAASETLDDYENLWRGTLTSDPVARPDSTPNQAGDQYFNTVLNKIFYFNGAQWVANSDTGFTIGVTPLTFNGSQTVFTLNRAPAAASNVVVEVNGAIQRVDTYTIGGTTLTFSEAPPAGSGEARVFALTNSVVEPADESVNAGKIMSGAVAAIRNKLSVYSQAESDNALAAKIDKAGGTFTGAVNANGLFTFADPAANTKKFKFDASGITAGQTRTLILPDKDITLRDGQWELIQKIDVSGNPATITVTNLTAYDRLKVSGWLFGSVDSINAVLNLSTDNGATFPAGASDYYYQRILLANSGSLALANVNAAFVVAALSMGTSVINAASFNLEIFAVNKAVPKMTLGVCHYKASVDGTGFSQLAGRWTAGGSVAANAFRLAPTSGTFVGGSVIVEGIKG